MFITFGVYYKDVINFTSFIFLILKIMKTKNFIYISFSTLLIIFLFTSSTFAMYVHSSNGQWGRFMKNSWEGQIQHNPDNLISNIEKSDLSSSEEQSLYYQYSEEKLAHDIYTYFYELYWTQVFSNIASSESQHMEAVRVLLDRYDLEAPTTYWELQETYDVLKAEWEKSLQSALEVWAKIEILDIEDIVDTIKETDNDDIKLVLTNIGWASYNHLRWFLNTLSMNNLETDIDYNNYLTQDQLNTKWSIKYLLVDRLESEWVSVSEINNKSQNTRHTNTNSSLLNKYKLSLKSKYGKKIDNLSTDKLNLLSEKINALSLKINSGNYSISVKQKYISMFDALNDLVTERITELQINELFE